MSDGESGFESGEELINGSHIQGRQPGYASDRCLAQKMMGSLIFPSPINDCFKSFHKKRDKLFHKNRLKGSQNSIYNRAY